MKNFKQYFFAGTFFVAFLNASFAAKVETKPASAETKNSSKAPSNLEIVQKLRDKIQLFCSDLSDLSNVGDSESVDEHLLVMCLEGAVYLAEKKDPEIYYTAESLMLVEKKNPKKFKKLWSTVNSNQKSELEQQMKKAREILKNGNG